MAQKTITRWIGKERFREYSFWQKEPQFDKIQSKFVDSDGKNVFCSKDGLSKGCSSRVRPILPFLKKMRIGQCRKVKITVFD